MRDARDGPPCIKCAQQTTFDSVQIVRRPHGDEMMRIFRCEKCGLLSAERAIPEEAT
jgi:hypothetical protein